MSNRESAAHVRHEAVQSSRSTLLDKRILIVEDEAIVAVDYHFQLLEAGARPLAYKSTNEAALEFLETHEVDAVIVDYRLADGNSEPVMRWLREHDIPFVVVTANTPEMRHTTPGDHILDKPVTSLALRVALTAALHVAAPGQPGV